jgi:hypothetical protein
MSGRGIRSSPQTFEQARHVVEQIDEIVRPVRGSNWQTSQPLARPGRRERLACVHRHPQYRNLSKNGMSRYFLRCSASSPLTPKAEVETRPFVGHTAELEAIFQSLRHQFKLGLSPRAWVGAGLRGPGDRRTGVRSSGTDAPGRTRTSDTRFRNAMLTVVRSGFEAARASQSASRAPPESGATRVARSRDASRRIRPPRGCAGDHRPSRAVHFARLDAGRWNP